MRQNFTSPRTVAALILSCFLTLMFNVARSQCTNANKPTFGFNLNATTVANNNNGMLDPKEKASITICDGQSYTVSNHFSSGADLLYKIQNTASGGSLLLNGIEVTTGVTIINNSVFLNLAGEYTFSLADPAVSGNLAQTVTAFKDLNNNGSLDAGDCAGEPLYFSYAVTKQLLWYKDLDGDHHASATLRACTSPGTGWTSVVLPVDDCNDNDAMNSGPLIGFTLNSTAITNKNNGSTDPSELASFTFCDNELYVASGYFTNNPDALFSIKNTLTGGSMLLNGVPLVTGVTIVNSSVYLNLSGNYTFTLSNPKAAGMLKQIVTPFIDQNGNGLPDAGDCIGDPLLITYFIKSSTTFYQDADGDGYGNLTVKTSACTKPAGYVTNNTDCNDNDKNVHSPVKYYRDADGDGYGDYSVFTTSCTSLPPMGYVKNDYDCDDHQKVANANTARIKMCHNGVTECVYARDLKVKLCQGYTLGTCPRVCTTISARTTVGSVDHPAVTDVQVSLPQEYKLSNYPNPFAATSTIQYELPFDSKVSIKVYDVLGRAVTTLVNEDKKAGAYKVDFNASRFNNGSFYYRIIAKSKDGVFEQTNNMTQLK